MHWNVYATIKKNVLPAELAWKDFGKMNMGKKIQKMALVNFVKTFINYFHSFNYNVAKLKLNLQTKPSITPAQTNP